MTNDLPMQIIGATNEVLSVAYDWRDSVNRSLSNHDYLLGFLMLAVFALVVLRIDEWYKRKERITELSQPEPSEDGKGKYWTGAEL